MAKQDEDKKDDDGPSTSGKYYNPCNLVKNKMGV